MPTLDSIPYPPYGVGASFEQAGLLYWELGLRFVKQSYGLGVWSVFDGPGILMWLC